MVGRYLELVVYKRPTLALQLAVSLRSGNAFSKLPRRFVGLFKCLSSTLQTLVEFLCGDKRIIALTRNL